MSMLSDDFTPDHYLVSFLCSSFTLRILHFIQFVWCFEGVAGQ